MTTISTATPQALKGNVEGHNREAKGSKHLELPRTLEDLQMLLQVEGDRRVTQALKKVNESWQAKYEAEIEKLRGEAEKLAELKFQHKEQALLEGHRREMGEKERALQEKELEIKTVNLLAQRKLPVEFRSFISGTNEADTLQRVNDFLSLWQVKLDEAVKLSSLLKA